MHKRSPGNPNLVPFNLEIKAAAQKWGGEARRGKRAVVVMAPEDNWVLRDYALSQGSGITSSIVSSTVEANNFELIPTHITFVERDQFGGHLSENPNTHLHKFLMKCDTIKLNGVSTDAIRLWLFPFSLKDRASGWLQNEGPNSFTTWEVLSQAFLSKYFPLEKTAKLRSDITYFTQRNGVSLYEA